MMLLGKQGLRIWAEEGRFEPGSTEPRCFQVVEWDTETSGEPEALAQVPGLEPLAV